MAPVHWARPDQRPVPPHHSPAPSSLRSVHGCSHRGAPLPRAAVCLAVSRRHLAAHRHPIPSPSITGRVDLHHSSNPRPDQHVEGTRGQPNEKHDASAPGSPLKPKGRTGPDLYPSARREGTLEREPRQQGTDWCSYNMASFEPRKKFIHKHNPRHTEDEAQHSSYGANQRCENCSLRKTAYPITQRNAYE